MEDDAAPNPSLAPILASAVLPGLGDLLIRRAGVRLRGILFMSGTGLSVAAYLFAGYFGTFAGFWTFRCLFLLNVISAILTSRSLHVRLSLLRMGALFFAAVPLGRCSLRPCSTFSASVSTWFRAQVFSPRSFGVSEFCRTLRSEPVPPSILELSLSREHLCEAAGRLRGATGNVPGRSSKCGRSSTQCTLRNEWRRF